ncbi:MAG: hypothetical protein QM572_12110 [Nocardioides sp.]|uniref:hypothetical protein n=1 Tax=Nocardioides sp. TaxID=35761 RepID=UPI0039E52DCE
MITALWRLSAAIRAYLRFYMPTNRAVDWLRSPRGLKWAFPAALVATPTYLGLTALAIALARQPHFGFMNILVLLFYWNAMKFAWMGVLGPLCQLRLALRRASIPASQKLLALPACERPSPMSDSSV